MTRARGRAREAGVERRRTGPRQGATPSVRVARARCQGRQGHAAGDAGRVTRAPSRRSRCAARGHRPGAPLAPRKRPVSTALRQRLEGPELRASRAPASRAATVAGASGCAGLCCILLHRSAGRSMSVFARFCRVLVALFGAFWRVVASTKHRVSRAFRTVDARGGAGRALSGGSWRHRTHPMTGARWRRGTSRHGRSRPAMVTPAGQGEGVRGSKGDVPQLPPPGVLFDASRTRTPSPSRSVEGGHGEKLHQGVTR